MAETTSGDRLGHPLRGKSLRSGVVLLVVVMAASAMGIWLANWLRGSNARDVYPNRPIELVVPFSAGGGTDTFARIIKKAIDDNQLMSEPLVIINQGGAGATIGSRRVKDAEPDGYTMLLLHDAILTAKYHGTVEYGPEAFVPIAGTGEVGMVIAVREDSRYRSLDDLLEDVAARPDQVTFGANIGALTHFAGLQLEKLYKDKHASPPASNVVCNPKFRFAQIGGGADRFSDLMGGHIDVTGFSIEEFIRFRAEGLRGLAYFGKDRHDAASDVPTAVEQAYDVISTNTFYWWFPAGTPTSRVDTMATTLQRAMKTDYVQRRMDAIHCAPIYVRGEELTQRIDKSARVLGSVASIKTAPLPNLPIVLAMAVGLMGGVIVVGSRRTRSRSIAKPLLRADWHGRTGLAAWCAVLTVLYVLLISAGNVDFRFATATYVFAVGASLTADVRLRRGLVVLALLTGFGLYYVFTELFVIDLADI